MSSISSESAPMSRARSVQAQRSQTPSSSSSGVSGSSGVRKASPGFRRSFPSSASAQQR